MESTTWFLITIVISLFVGVGIGWWFGKGGKKAVMLELEELKKEIKEKL